MAVGMCFVAEKKYISLQSQKDIGTIPSGMLKGNGLQLH
jgi:hypothetical protein